MNDSTIIVARKACTADLKSRRKPSLVRALWALVASSLLSCVPPTPFDSASFLRQQYAEQIGAERAARISIPFMLDDEVLEEFSAKVKPSGDDRSRVSRILDYVFKGIDLTYSLTPTRNAVETYNAREGNCLSFVNLFVGLGRYMKLNPFYVEVTDFQRWDQREGMVVSQGHIVAGLFISGEMRTYDFLPYRVKAYKDFKQIDDLRATAHFYNNLGAEALLAGDLDRAMELLEIAASIDPAFTKGINNYGVAHARRGEYRRAIELYREGLKADPDDVPLLTNLARAHQQLGEIEQAEALLGQIEGYHHTNPFFFVYRGELALSRGDHAQALEYLRQAMRRDAEVPEVHLALVKVYIALGEVEKARHHLGRSLTLDATHPDALRYAELLASMN